MEPGMQSEMAVCCRGLSRSFGEIAALQDLNLDVPAGSIFGFLGRNGAGKTTTMRLLTGLAFPTSGRAWIAGVETTNGSSGARSLFGYLPQEPAFYGWMSAVEFLDYVGRIFGMEAARRKHRVASVLSRVGLQDSADRRISGYSGGMKQRLGIAQALLHEPPVLILDEPTSALDPAGRHELLDLIDSLRGNSTVFFSSHILDDVDRVCDHIAVLHAGRLLEVAPRKVLLEKYAADAVEIEFGEAGTPAVEAFRSELEKTDWIESLEEQDDLWRILVSDRVQAEAFLPGLVLESGMVLRRYEWVQPTLEEVFLEMSE